MSVKFHQVSDSKTKFIRH